MQWAVISDQWPTSVGRARVVVVWGLMFTAHCSLPLDPDGLLAGYGYRGKPVEAVGLLTADDSAEFFLQSSGDRTYIAFSNRNPVHGADGGDLGCGASEESFVGDVKHFARDSGF